MQRIKSIRANSWMRGAFYVLLLFLIYRSTFVYLFDQWLKDDFTYCFIIPFIVFYLVWEKRGRLAAMPSIPSWKGLLSVGFGGCLFFVGELAAEYTILYFSFWLVAVGLCWLHVGWRKLKCISFPVLFSLAMFVPPGAIYSPLSFRLKLISSQLGVAMIQSYGLSAYREGNVIDLGFTRLQVVDACSGLRFVIPLFLMGLLLAYYYRVAFWKKFALVLSTIPLSIFTNSLRIASVGILYQFWGPKVAEGFFHDFSGWFIFVASLAFLLFEMWVLNKIFKSDERGAMSDESGMWSHKKGRSAESRESVWPPQSIAAAVLLTMTLVLAQGVQYREKKPQVKSFGDFPLQVGVWSGARIGMEQQFLDTLQLTDYVLIDYRDGQKKGVSLYVAYNGSQSKGKATHSPATCLPGSGWDFRESGSTALPSIAADSKEIQVSRAIMDKNGARQLVYYWFPQRGRILTNLYQVKLFNFWDAVIRQRTDGALVRLITSVSQDEAPGEAEARLQGFTRQIIPVLEAYLPK